MADETFEEFVARQKKLEMEQDKKALDWDNIRTFKPDILDRSYPELVESTQEFAHLAREAGLDIAFFYTPCTIIFNDHDEKLALCGKSRAVDNPEAAIQWFKENVPGHTIWLLNYTKGIVEKVWDEKTETATPTGRIVDKIRYFTIDMKEKL